VEPDELLTVTADVLDDLGVRYAVVGSVASSYYGETRYTHDVDVVVEMSLSQVRRLCAAFPPPDWYVSRTAAEEAVRHRRQFNLLHPESGGKVDFMLVRDDEWGSLQLDRRENVDLLDNRRVFAAHPEDVILGKLLYFEEGASDKHLRDVAGILQVSGDLVDRDRVDEWAAKLGVLAHWRAVVDKVDAQPEPPDVPF
jgi:hypothetical protein